VLLPSFATKNANFVKRFQREAKAIARLHHPNILSVHDFGIDRDYYYIVMRYVEGAQTLNHIIHRRPNSEQIFKLISQVANALAYAHKKGVIHRDVKPSNILLDEGWALLSDFGLAKVDKANTKLTDSGRGIGTPAYMSPEQAQGAEIDHRSDIYALGVVLYELLTGTIPHDAPTALGILLKRTTQPAPSPRTINPAIPESVEQVVLRSLAFQPEERYDSATDFIAALKNALADASYREPVVRSLDNRGTVDLALSPPLESSDKRTFDFALQASTGPGPQKDSSKEKWSNIWRNPVWPAVAGASIATIALVWGGSAFGFGTSPATPTPTISIVAVAPTSTDTPTFTPTPTPTNTAVPTDTPAPPTPTNTPLSPTSTPTHTAAPPTPTPTNSPTTEIILPAALPMATPTQAVPAGVITLLKPLSLNEPSYGPTDFEWEWAGDLPPGFGFEVRVWREGEPPAGAHNAVEDNQIGRIMRVGENRYRLSVDIKDAAGVRNRTGEYLWTVAVVQISPNYADLGQQARPAYLRFEAGGGGKNSDGGGGSIS
jgi:serine/threonine protein kinase